MGLSTIKRSLKDVALHGLAHAKEMLGAESKYCIRGGYRHRTKYSYFDDTALADEYQKEVYLRAAEIARAEQVKTVYDVGCGSGYKLIHYLGEYDTVGFDVPETLPFLRKTYPERKWAHAPFSDRTHPPADLVVCSDVIEHVLNPDELMGFLMSLTSKHLVFCPRRTAIANIPHCRDSSSARRIPNITFASGRSKNFAVMSISLSM